RVAIRVLASRPPKASLQASASHRVETSSRTMNPTLCLVAAYLGPGFPSPTMRYILDPAIGIGSRAQRGLRPQTSGLRPDPRAMFTKLLRFPQMDMSSLLTRFIGARTAARRICLHPESRPRSKAPSCEIHLSLSASAKRKTHVDHDSRPSLLRPVARGL